MSSLDRLIDALESGEYNQITEFLKLGDCFCFAGVMCDLFHKETGEGQWEYKESPSGEPPYAYFRLQTPTGPWTTSTFPPPEVVEYFGIFWETAMRLINLNDQGSSFKELAQRLRDWKSETPE